MDDMKCFKSIIILLLFLHCGNSARILGVIPTASISHQIPFRPLWKELSLRGHQVTLMTTDPMRDPNLTNLTEIDLHFTYELNQPIRIMNDESKGIFEKLKLMFALLEESTERQFLLPEVQSLIKNGTFDLVISELLYATMVPFSWKFNCPLIGVSSMDASLLNHQAVGNPAHPILYPEYNVPAENPMKMSFRERLRSVIHYFLFSYFMKTQHFVTESERLKTFFGDDMPSVTDILSSHLALLLVNTHPIFHNPRPVGPTTIYIGDGIHISPPKPLPKHLKQFLDDTKQGVIYLSLGSNVDSHMLSQETISNITETFSDLPYDVLWKFDKKIENLDPKIKIEHWLPQADILRHPNVKLFITQGGLQSLQESVSTVTPIVCIPFFGDQHYNCNRMVTMHQTGRKVRKDGITKENLRGAIEDVIGNEMYKKNVEELKTLMYDNPQTGLEKAIWWTEYVIRHNGTRHLRSPSVDVPTYQYYLLDVIVFIAIIVLFLTYVPYLLISKFFFKIRRQNVKEKVQ